MSNKYYSSTIQKGSSGNDVKTWQEFLNTQGYGVSVNSNFDDNTLKATQSYQKANGITSDGIVGEQTWGKAGYKNLNTPVSAPEFKPMPTNPTYDQTTWDETTKGKEALGAYNTAKDAVSEYKPFEFSQNGWLENVKSGIQNYGDFTFDLNGDALYQQYKDKYIQHGKLAMQDAIGQASAMTGGYGNSYAQSVGQQQYQASLDNLNDIIPEIYQMQLDRYNTGKQDLYNQYGMLLSEYEREYGAYSDEYNKLLDKLGIYQDDYYKGGELFYTERDNKNSIAAQEFADAMSIWNNNTDQAWERAKWDESARQYVKDELWKQLEVSDTTDTPDILWYPTGTTDEKGNYIFRNSENKTMAFGPGVNPYTGTKHADAKHGTFSNGYQPNNIDGKKLKNSGMSTSITGKEQTIWECNGKYWLWRGELNKYVEVDISDIK